MEATMKKVRAKKANTVEFTPEAYDSLKQIASAKRWSNKVTADEAMKALKEKLQQPPNPSS